MPPTNIKISSILSGQGHAALSTDSDRGSTLLKKIALPTQPLSSVHRAPGRDVHLYADLLEDALESSPHYLRGVYYGASLGILHPKSGDPILFPMIDSEECLGPEEGFLRTGLIGLPGAAIGGRQSFSQISIPQISVYRMKDS